MKNIEKFTVNSSKSIRETIKRLDQSGIGFIVVVDNNKKVVGVITDGDFRRAILDGVSLDDNVLQITNRNYKYLNIGHSTKEAIELLKNPSFSRIPVLDSGELVEIIKAEEFLKLKKQEKTRKIESIPVVIMAGGKGTRLEPFTKILPKPLIPVGEKAIIDHIMDEFKSFGVNEFFLTLNYKSEMIKAYFSNGNKKGLNLHFIDEEKYLGTAGSLSFLKDKINGDFFVTNCDILVKADYTSVLKYHRKNNAALTVISSLQHYKIPYGVIDYKQDGGISRIIEKPENSITINTGVYIMTKECLEFIPENTQFDMTTLITDLISKDKRVVMYPVNESEYIDIGQWEQFKHVSDKIQKYM